MGTLQKPVWIETRSGCTYRYYYTDGTGSRKQITSWPMTISQNMEIAVETGSGNPDGGNTGTGGTDGGNTGTAERIVAIPAETQATTVTMAETAATREQR